MEISADKFREVLIYLRDNEQLLGREATVDGLTAEETNFYIGLQLDEGLIDAKKFSNKASGTFYYPTRVTMKGHKFLDGVADISDWKKAKEAVGYVTTIIGIAEIIKFVIESST